MIQHVCDRCHDTMMVWHVVGLSEELNPEKGLYNPSMDRLRFEQNKELCEKCFAFISEWFSALASQKEKTARE